MRIQTIHVNKDHWSTGWIPISYESLLSETQLQKSRVFLWHKDNEEVLEVYYNAQITPWLNLSPSIQYISDPGGTNDAKDAVVFGLRAQITF